MSPLERYHQDLAKAGFLHDPAQEAVIMRLQRLYEELLSRPQQKESIFQNIMGAIGLRPKCEPVIKGIYMWGGVGRGKTYLMDIFYESLPFEEKIRTHFHRFMRRVHHDLTDLKGEKNPLEHVADRIKTQARILCFDEFFVADITDAMILANLLKALFERGVALVTTSNIIPDGLYENGLQRERFLPAIKLLNQHTEVIQLDGGVDYRLRALTQASLFYHPAGEDADQSLSDCFERLVPEVANIQQSVALEIEGRSLLALREADDVVWFDFKVLCEGPRSQQDYIVLAKEYHAVIVSNVPEFDGRNDDAARRFIYLVDEFYDRRVKLVASGAVALQDLYKGEQLRFEFERTVSRLLEMQSQEYLSEPHRP